METAPVIPFAHVIYETGGYKLAQVAILVERPLCFFDGRTQLCWSSYTYVFM